MKRTIKLVPKQNQRVKIKSGEIKKTELDGFTFLEFPFSSEFPVERYFGKEILSHENGAMEMGRFEQYMPLLFNHDLNQQLGVVTEAWVGDDKRGYCKVKLSRTDFAKEKAKDINDEILMNVSFWYEIKDIKLAREADGETPEYLVTKFCPLEISFVTVPADPSVGLGRTESKNDTEIEIEVGEDDVPAVEVEAPDVVTAENDAEVVESENNPDSSDEEVQKEKERSLNKQTQSNKGVEVMKTDAQQEQERILSIQALAANHGQSDLATKFIAEGRSAADFALELVKVLGGKVQKINDSPLDLSRTELKNYSVIRAINAVIAGKWDKAGFEKECSDEIGKQYGRAVNGSGFFMPTNVLARAPYAAGATATGGAMVQTSVVPDLIDILRPKSVLLKAGIRTLTGLIGNVAIPRKNGRSSVYWIAENGTITESEATFDQVSMTPKHVGALANVSKQLLAQSSISADSFITQDLNDELAIGIDLAGLVGTNAGGQPKGLINVSGIGSVPIGVNGGPLTNDLIIDLETAVADQNADADSMSYITNSKQVGAIKKLKDGSGRYLYPNLELSKQGQVNGYALHRTNNVPRTLTKGSGTNLSAVFFGDWSQMVMAQWMAGIEIVVNPFGASFAKGGVDIRAMSMCDFAVRHPESFAAITDAT